MKDLRELSKKIHSKLNEVSTVFGQFQTQSTLNCPPGCGKCCYKSDISCSPYELLPMAFSLMENGKAEAVLAKAYSPNGLHCLFLEVKDELNRMGSCTEYENRPFICRAFGVSARYGKHQSIEVSICKTLRDKQGLMPLISYSNDEIPHIDSWKKNLETIDPQLLLIERPINESIIFLLEKLLLWKQLAPLDFCTNDSFSTNS